MTKNKLKEILNDPIEIWTRHPSVAIVFISLGLECSVINNKPIIIKPETSWYSQVINNRNTEKFSREIDSLSRWHWFLNFCISNIQILLFQYPIRHFHTFLEILRDFLVNEQHPILRKIIITWRHSVCNDGEINFKITGVCLISFTLFHISLKADFQSINLI